MEFHMPDFYNSNGIQHQKSCVYTPQQNGIMERKHQHFLNMARAPLFQASLLTKFWGDAILTASYGINRTPTPLLNNQSPYEVLFSSSPSYAHLKVFSCLCSVSTLKHNRTKLDPMAEKCIFIGYPISVKGYKVYNLENHTPCISRDVTFIETVFHFQNSSSSQSSPYSDLVIPLALSKFQTLLTDSEQSTSPFITPIPFQTTGSSSLINFVPIEPEPEHTSSILDLEPNSAIVPRRTDWVRRTPSYLQDYHCHLASQFPSLAYLILLSLTLLLIT